MKVLFIEADMGEADGIDTEFGWSDLLCGKRMELPDAGVESGLWAIPAGSSDRIDDRAVSAPMVRAAIEPLVRAFNVIVVSGGSLQHRLSSQFLLSAADVGVLAMQPSDTRATVLGQIDRLDTLPRNGAVAVMRRALPSDPWLVVRT